MEPAFRLSATNDLYYRCLSVAGDSTPEDHLRFRRYRRNCTSFPHLSFYYFPHYAVIMT